MALEVKELHLPHLQVKIQDPIQTFFELFKIAIVCHILYLEYSFFSKGGRGRMESEDKRRIREMEETIRMKNKQIHQLLEDVEEVLNKAIV